MNERTRQPPGARSTGRIAVGRRRRTWPLIVAAALLLQSLFPSGYMPGNPASGWLVMLCPEGLPAGFVRQLAGQAGHAHHLDMQAHAGHGDESAGGHHGGDSPLGSCQLSSVLDQAGDVVHAALSGCGFLPVTEHTFVTIAGLASRAGLIPQSRAPPFV